MNVPYDQIRACIKEIRTFELKERSGMFCEYLQEALLDATVDFSDAKFECILEEPYNAFYNWNFGTFDVDVSIAAGSLPSEWKITGEKDGRRFWRKGSLTDFQKGTVELVEMISEILNG